MSSPRPLEQILLAKAHTFLADACKPFSPGMRFEARLQLLEASASRLGTFSAAEYATAFGIERLLPASDLERLGAALLELLYQTPIHPSLALSALAREPLALQQQKEAGAYNTDFRLAQLVAERGVKVWLRGRPAIDPACGAGMLLCAVTLSVCGHDRRKAAEWLSKSVHAADTSSLALRGARLALGSFTDNLDAIIQMHRNWFCGDSLLREESDWLVHAPEGYGLVVANPPWEKVKVTRHEYARAKGRDRHVGASHNQDDLFGLDGHRAHAATYARELAKRYPIAVAGEVDLYVAFVELFLRLAQNGGGVSALVPAGLIRSQGTEALRREVIAKSSATEIALIENHARFFAIDTRFKFLALAIKTRRGSKAPRTKHLLLSHVTGTDVGCESLGSAKMGLRTLGALRTDLTIPEVRNTKEWHLFARASRAGVTLSRKESSWEHEFCREVDMTKERPLFKDKPAPGRIAIIEGRMVHQHRFGAKAYISGSGRRAVWDPLPVGCSTVRPQFWMEPGDLPAKALERSRLLRAGFCDITGQTNERSMMAALIPPGVVCGNKVPTVLFGGPNANDRLHLWVGLVNSLPFDWMLRRLVTTTVNYFVLESVPLPKIGLGTLPGRQIVEAVKELRGLDSAGGGVKTLRRIAELKAKIDVLALIGFRATFADLELILRDFPLLDRGQPALTGEIRSTITRDYLLLSASRRFQVKATGLAKRVAAATKLGAIPYVPPQMETTDEQQNESCAS